MKNFPIIVIIVILHLPVQVNNLKNVSFSSITSKELKKMSLQRIFARGKAFSDKESGQDYKKEDITLRFFRKLARPVVKFLDPYTFVTPNRLTWFGFSWVIIGAWLLLVAESNVFLLFLVGFCYWFAAYIDSMDGMLARLLFFGFV